MGAGGETAENGTEISGEEALHSMRAVFASLESSEKGKAVDICGEELKA